MTTGLHQIKGQQQQKDDRESDKERIEVIIPRIDKRGDRQECKENDGKIDRQFV